MKSVKHYLTLFETIENPFKLSKIQQPVYHGTQSNFNKFRREAHGIYFTPYKNWAKDHYGNNIIICYVDVRKIKVISWNEEESDWFYDREYDKISEYLSRLEKEGYDCVEFGGESGSFVVFGNAKILNAKTGKYM